MGWKGWIWLLCWIQVLLNNQPITESKIVARQLPVCLCSAPHNFIFLRPYQPYPACFLWPHYCSVPHLTRSPFWWQSWTLSLGVLRLFSPSVSKWLLVILSLMICVTLASYLTMWTFRLFTHNLKVLNWIHSANADLVPTACQHCVSMAFCWVTENAPEDWGWKAWFRTQIPS